MGLEEKLNIARRELLDLSFRNPLINFKLRKTTGLVFLNVDTIKLFEYLVVEGKSSTFSSEYSNKPNKLMCDLDQVTLQQRLNKTYRNNQLFLSEKGANTLFLALGFLHWQEDDINYKSPLVLVPVELNKTIGKELYQLRYSFEDVKVNDSLVEKIKQTFDIDLYYETEEFDISRYFNFIKSNLINNMYVDEFECCLDFFSYQKFLMYRFLDYKNWVKDGEVINKDMMDKLFFSGFKQENIKNPDINLIESPNKFYHVVDCDSTQALAINDINNGISLVLQGPPGTGKSQTIANIISNAVAMNKSVLFVAEKKAALDVVYDRLKRVGLDDLAIELHSDKVNRVDFLKALEKTLTLGEVKKENNEELFNKFIDVRNDLNDYKNIVNSNILDSKKSLVEIYGVILKIREELDNQNIRLPRVKFKNIEKWNNKDYEKRLDLVKEFSDLMKSIKQVNKHPFYGSKLSTCLPFEQISIKEKLIDLEQSLALLIKASNEMSNLVGNKGNNSIFECIRFIKSIEYAANFIDCENIFVASYYFSNKDNKIIELLKLCKNIQEFEKNNSYEKYFDVDFIKNYEIYFKSKEKRSVKKEAYEYIIKFVNDKKQLQSLYSHMLNHLTLIDSLDILKSLYKDFSLDMDFDLLISKTKEIINMHELISEYKLILQTKFLVNDKLKLEKLTDLINNFNQALSDFKASLELFERAAKFDFVSLYNYNEWYIDTPLLDIRKMLQGFINNIDRIVEIVRYNDLSDKFHILGIYEIIEISNDFKYDFEYLNYILAYEYYDSLVNRAYEEYPSLVDFKKFKMMRKIDLFKQYDMSLMIENIKEILKRHYEFMPRLDQDSPMMNMLRREFQKKRNLMPIKKLISKCDKITKIKPVFMMSPLSVSTYLTPGKIEFDLVIFDEASQVRPVDAFGPILMGKQVVVVGDSKQLPPTTFFDSLTNKFDELSDSDYDIANMESILSLLLSKNINERTLKWHYRSRHLSLIALSNQEFYDSNLMIFPSTNNLDKEDGLVFKYIPNSIYQRGETRSNPIEAKRVVEEVFNHIENNPSLSLGVAAFSMAQADEIYKEFERKLRVRKNEKVIEFLNNSKEPFFIKNLENVQGDERDVIFISIGYGKDKDGHVSMDFGPLNRDGGERRLNVLITRAKRKCVVFSNILSTDINPSKTQAKGVIGLKKFLEYAQNRGIYTANNNEEENSFTNYLYNKLVDYGYKVDKFVGSKGNSIDLAIIDPKNSDKYILGIETDGGTYKILDSTTDRERIRSQVLKNLGWKIYHIYSCDYYRNPKVEFENLLNYIDSIKELEQEEIIKPELYIKRSNVKVNKNVKYTEDYKVYQSHKRRISVLDEEDTLKTIIEGIIKVEAPINISLLKKRLLSLVELNKFSEKNKRMIDNVLNNLNPNIILDNDFYFIKDQEIKLRNRSNLDIMNKKIDLIPNIEIKNATYLVINVGLATSIEEIRLEVANLLGISKGQNLIQKVNEFVKELVDESKIYEENELYYIVD